MISLAFVVLNFIWGAGPCNPASCMNYLITLDVLTFDYEARLHIAVPVLYY